MAGRHRGALILVVELGGPTMFARIGVMRALKPRPCSRVLIRRESSMTVREKKLRRDL